MLALATLDKPNLLILDEPTNHLDIDARNELLTALNDFDGAVILVSHDRRLIEATADRLLLVADGKVHAVRRRSGRLSPLPAVRRQHADATGCGQRKPRPKPGGESHQGRRAPRRRGKAPDAEAAEGQSGRRRIPDRGADRGDRPSWTRRCPIRCSSPGIRPRQRRLQETRRRRAQAGGGAKRPGWRPAKLTKTPMSDAGFAARAMMD